MQSEERASAAHLNGSLTVATLVVGMQHHVAVKAQRVAAVGGLPLDFCNRPNGA
jgi:hypothetical protein